MVKRRNPKCPKCEGKRTIKRGFRNGRRRYQCKECSRHFSGNHRRKKPVFWIQHMDGLAFRKFGYEHNLSSTQVYENVKNEMQLLPSNMDISKNICDPSKWSGILNLDGKYIKVLEIKRPNKRSIPFIYGIDFLSHDIPLGFLAYSESEDVFFDYFLKLKEIGYPLKVIVCDEVAGLRPALSRVFPSAKIQLCHTHFLENIRKSLQVRIDPTYRDFFHSLVDQVFHTANSKEERSFVFDRILRDETQDNNLLKNVVERIKSHEEELFAYQSIPNCPYTNNLIECFNSHLNGRLKTIKGFQTFCSAQLFLNAWILRRRTKPFTDCNHPFKHLNGKMSLQVVLKDTLQLEKVVRALQAPQIKLRSKFQTIFPLGSSDSQKYESADSHKDTQRYSLKGATESIKQYLDQKTCFQGLLVYPPSPEDRIEPDRLGYPDPWAKPRILGKVIETEEKMTGISR